MKYLLVLTPTEAKKFIAKSLVRKSETLRKALNKGTVLMHPSTSTSFLYEELVGERPEGLCFIGAIAPKGTCISRDFEEIAAKREKGFDHRSVIYSWVFRAGKLVKEVPLGECLNEMGPGDFYVKGVNVIDPQGNAGVLAANPDGGTIIRALTLSRQKKFDLLLLATLNKLIPVSIEEASKTTGRDKLDGAMGIPTSLFKIPGTLITETEAFRHWGVTATPIAAGGLREAEGAFVHILDGTETEVRACLEVVGECKGARVEARFADCEVCRYGRCNLSTVNRGVLDGVLGIESLASFMKSQRA